MQQTTNLATSVVFLMSSMYGTGGPTLAMTANAAIATDTPAPKIILQDRASVESYLKAEYADTPILVDIAQCESDFRQYDSDGNLMRGKIDKDDVGVMQINEKYHAAQAKELGLDLSTIEGNVAYAKILYSKEGTSPWKASQPCWGTSSDLTINK